LDIPGSARPETRARLSQQQSEGTENEDFVIRIESRGSATPSSRPSTALNPPEIQLNSVPENKATRKIRPLTSEKRRSLIRPAEVGSYQAPPKYVSVLCLLFMSVGFASSKPSLWHLFRSVF
jgi:hypothetical protein